jgi:hypothetical protein
MLPMAVRLLREVLLGRDGQAAQSVPPDADQG